LVADVGSGINWKRKGLTYLLEQSMQGNISEIVVAHKDRLCRFAFELLSFIFKQNNTQLIVLNQETSESNSRELADDILSIIHVYSCRAMGKRRYSNKKNQDLSKQETDTDVKELDGHL
jgi:predicted site-specific integrase-resolvase